MAAKNSVKLCFDMDGTICGLYDVPNWLYYLENEMTFPYEQAKPLVNLSALARRLNTLQRNGYHLVIISWTSKSGGEDYHRAIAEAKLKWLAKHMPSVNWNEIHIIPYGTPKENYCDSLFDVLFDDEAKNRINWNGIAFDEKEMMGMLKVF